MEPFTVILPSDSAFLYGLRRRLTTWLRSVSLPDAAIDSLVLATHEAAANGIEHASSGSPVIVDARVENGQVILDVTTTGRWGAQSHGSQSDERGRGLGLIRGVVPDPEILLDGERVTVRLRTSFVTPEGRESSSRNANSV